ncbi:MAG: TerB family tellurite resistance protein [Candidatus Omnitrophica bacterium]|nr:TerB family tellurite resistance protein [Candidatus Omnitrophota bacterium]
MSLKDLVAAVIADGKVDADEVTQLRTEIYADSVVSKEEVEALFQINDACSGNVDPSFVTLMSDAVCDATLNDAGSPGVIDATEAQWLTDLLMKDGGVDATERAVLVAVRAKAISIDPAFDAALKSLGI